MVQRVDAALDGELPPVIGALLVDHGVAWQRQPPPLHELLQPGLGILQHFRGRQRIDARTDHRLDQRPGRDHATVEQRRAEDRLQRIGEDGFAQVAAALEFAGTQPDVIAELEFAGDLGQRPVAHQARAHSGKVAFRGVGPALEQQRGNGEVQQRIAEKLQPFVVRIAAAAVGQGLLEQAGVLEGIRQPRQRGRMLRIN